MEKKKKRLLFIIHQEWVSICPAKKFISNLNGDAVLLCEEVVKVVLKAGLLLRDKKWRQISGVLQSSLLRFCMLFEIVDIVFCIVVCIL